MLNVTAHFRNIAAAVATLLLSGCASNPADFVADAAATFEQPFASTAPAIVLEAQQSSWGPPQINPAEFDGGPQAVADADSRYLLDAGDKLRIFVYGQPNLSRAYTVGHDGSITVPLIGTIAARGQTTRELEEIIKRKLGREFVRDPQVTVDILQNRPFFIYGEVRTGGQFPYVSGMTVETAIAIAGGYSERASRRSYRITRRINGFVDQIDAPGDYVLQPGDTVLVHERFF